MNVRRDRLRIFMGFYFYPRGGSAYVARYLSRYLTAAGVSVRLITGSLGSAHAHTDAYSFYTGCDDVRVVDYGPAVQLWEAGAGDPLTATPPMHASYEDRGVVPDRVFGAMSPEVFQHQVRFWTQRFREAEVEAFDVLHLHHLTPQLPAALATGKPVIVHLHGTDLKFLAGCRSGALWPYADHWLAYFADAVQEISGIVAVSQCDADLAADLLKVPPGDITVIPNGVDVDEFDRVGLGPSERRELWRRWLVTDPRGWDESGEIGGVRYNDADLDRLFPVYGGRRIVLCVARFLTFKRLPYLLRAWARVRESCPPTTLVVWGGFPGEWEAPHPVTVARELGLDDVVFTGFRGHEDLSLGFNMADLLVNSARHEPFGQLLIEAMAAGIPVLAAARGGPLIFVRPNGGARNGWLFDPDSDTALETALRAAISEPAELRLRGRNAYQHARNEFSWRSICQEFVDLYQRHAAAYTPRAPGGALQ